MPELRFDLVSGGFALIATERAKRPSDFKAAQKPEEPARPVDPACPFCPGNEKMTPPEISALRGDTARDTEGWQVRVVPNKFPALVRPEDLPGEDAPSVPAEGPENLGTAMYWQVPGVGAHEVVVESTAHGGTLGSYPVDHLKDVLGVLKERSLLLYDRPEIRYVQVFKNQGPRGGASLAHPHFQVIGLPVMPAAVASEGARQREYEARAGRCLFCDLVEREIEKNVRIVKATPEFVALCPFGSRYSFETLIIPRKHISCFTEMGPADDKGLAAVMVDLFSRYEALFASMPYNMVFHGVPAAIRQKRKWPFHAHIHVYPRLNTEAGLELGTGVYINPSPPEAAAQQLVSVER